MRAVVVGGGLAGLAAALELSEPGRYASVTLLEARPTLGLATLAAIKGQRLDATTTAAAVDALPKDLAPIGNAAASAKLRLYLQGVLTRRALQQAQAPSTAEARPQ